MGNIDERIRKIREIMDREKADAYVVVTADYHNSEYPGEYFKEREYATGFTGSAGTLVVLKDQSALFTDGRYYIQAKKQLEGTGILLMELGKENVPTVFRYLSDRLKEGGCVAFDGRTVTVSFVSKLKEEFKGKKLSLLQGDYIDEIWTDRPELSKEPVWILNEKYAGITAEEKLCSIRKYLKDTGGDWYLIPALDEIAWILNLRGNDVICNPVFLSYFLVGTKESVLYVNKDILNNEVLKYLDNLNVKLRPYNDIYKDLEEIGEDSCIIFDEGQTNYMLKKAVKCKTKNIKSYIGLLKAEKNHIEQDNERKAHIKDGVAVTKFMYWLKKNVGKIRITEISAAQKLESLRMEQEGYIEPSFEPIMAYGAHGAIVHYSATEETDALLKPEGLLLSDTGAHYLEGTTDITRTYVLGPLTDMEKKCFTLVLKGHLNLANARFPYGICGANLDYLARGPLWKEGMDYNHGTGHGVGYLLNVHEGPNTFNWNVKSYGNTTVLKEGMITSDEPGVYIEGKFGIRHENLVMCVEDEINEFGRFMKFENLTMVPFDVEGIDFNYFSDEDVKRLNEYHKTVCETLLPYMNNEESRWLVDITKPVKPKGE